jgi:endonuclease YncB( thermonuclease family)
VATNAPDIPGASGFAGRLAGVKSCQAGEERSLRLPINIIAIFTLVLGLSWMSPHAASAVSKQPLEIRGFDGDTVQIGNTVYNLVGIDAPELGQVCDAHGHIQRCGLTAAYQLRKVLDFGKTSLKCQRLDVKEPGSAALTSCALGEEDVSLAMLQGGHAVVKPDAPPNYVAAQAQAKGAGLSIWGSKFVPPAEWRQGRRLAMEDKEGHEACVIKEISKKGRRLYFGPLDDVYDKIDVAASPEGRTFCTEEEARLAGWRRPLQQVH